MNKIRLIFFYLFTINPDEHLKHDLLFEHIMQLTIGHGRQTLVEFL